MRIDGACLIACLADPEQLTTLSGSDMAALVRLAWSEAVIYRLAKNVQASDVCHRLDPIVLEMFENAALQAEYHRRKLVWEIDRISAALADVVYPVLLLKGAAYEAAALPNAAGRLSSDVDILVARTHIESCEADLKAAGWAGEPHSDYDDAYYRQWMHEIPPLRHEQRKTIIDVHHTLLPLVSRLKPRPELLLADARQIDGLTLKIPCTEDLFIHSAIHCFYDGDFSANIRNLLDLADLLTAGRAQKAGYDAVLIDRAKAHGILMPVADALQAIEHARLVELGTQLTAFVAENRRILPLQALFEASVQRRTYRPRAFHRRTDRLAAFLLYIRSHWIKMPPLMLTKHLLKKVWLRLRGEV